MAVITRSDCNDFNDWIKVVPVPDITVQTDPGGENFHRMQRPEPEVNWNTTGAYFPLGPGKKRQVLYVNFRTNAYTPQCMLLLTNQPSIDYVGALGFYNQVSHNNIDLWNGTLSHDSDFSCPYDQWVNIRFKIRKSGRVSVYAHIDDGTPVDEIRDWEVIGTSNVWRTFNAAQADHLYFAWQMSKNGAVTCDIDKLIFTNNGNI